MKLSLDEIFRNTYGYDLNSEHAKGFSVIYIDPCDSIGIQTVDIYFPLFKCKMDQF
jgi:hypothetical protein